MPELINTATMPGDNMSPAGIEAAATNFRGVGSSVSTRGDTVHRHWQGISAVYEAPESATLTQAMNPAQTRAEAFGTDMEAAAKALDTFADEVRTIKEAVAKIRADAAALLGGITDGKVDHFHYGGGDYYTEQVDWHTHQETVDANNALIVRTNDQQEALWAAERTCASAIRAAVGLGPVLARDANNPNGYGVSEIPDNAPMPWGATVERTEGCLERAGDGVVDAGGAMLSGLGNLAGISYSDAEGFDWSWSTAGDAWGGTVQFGVGLATLSPLALAVTPALPGPVGRYVRDAQFSVAAGVSSMVAIDLYAEDPFHKWREDGAHAFGETLFNVATLPVAALKAGAVARVGRLGRGDAPDAPDAGDAAAATRAAGDAADSVRGIDITDVTSLGQRADLDSSVDVRSDVDIDLGDAAPGDASPGDAAPGDGVPDDATPGDGVPDDAAPGDATPGDGAPGQPEIGSGSGTPDDPRVYGYQNPAEALRNAPEPDADDLAGVGKSKDYQPGSVEHMQARWQEYVEDKSAKGTTPWGWERWRDTYVANQGHAPRGEAFEQAYRADHPAYETGGYQFNALAPNEHGFNRNYDIVSVRNFEALELKSGRDVDRAQVAKDAQMVEDGWTVRYVFGQQPTPGTLRLLEEAGIDYEIFHSVPVLIE